MDGDIKVSVIIPIYNAGEWLSHTLSCLSSQKMSTLEFVCVLDCPTDGSDNVVTAFAESDNRFVVVRNESNVGVAASRNMGIKSARGEYIGFMDHDDWCENDMYEQLYIAAKNGDCDVVISDVVVEYAEQKKIERTPTDISNEELIDSLLYPVDSPLCKSRLARSVWHSIYKKTFLQDNDIYFLDRKEYLEEDTLFNLKVFTSSPKWIVLNMPLYHWNLKREVCEVNYRGYDDLNVFANYVRKVVECLPGDKIRKNRIVSYYAYRTFKALLREGYKECRMDVFDFSCISLKAVREVMGKDKWTMELSRNYLYVIKFCFFVLQIKIISFI